jgi:hypothetical protein
MAFQEIETGIWKPENDGDEITGVLLKKESNVGANDSNMYTFEVDNKPIAVWGSMVLDTRMVGVQEGEMVKIVFKGLGESSPGKNAPKIFQVLVDRDNQ